MNLVNSLHTYELLFTKEEASNSSPESRKCGPLFINLWVQTYLQHNGVLEFEPDILDQENCPYLLSFGRENDSIKSLIFNETFIFAGNENNCISVISSILQQFSKESITSVTLRGNYLADSVLKQLIPSMSQYEKLTVLEISNNTISNQSLEAMGMLFSNCPLISKVILNNNLLGQGLNQLQSIETFLN